MENKIGDSCNSLEAHRRSVTDIHPNVERSVGIGSKGGTLEIIVGVGVGVEIKL